MPTPLGQGLEAAAPPAIYRLSGGPAGYSWLSCLTCALENLTAAWKATAAKPHTRPRALWAEMAGMGWSGEGGDDSDRKMSLAQLLEHRARGAQKKPVCSVHTPAIACI